MHFLTCDRGCSLQPCDRQTLRNVTSFPVRVCGFTPIVDRIIKPHLALLLYGFIVAFTYPLGKKRETLLADWIKLLLLRRGGDGCGTVLYVSWPVSCLNPLLAVFFVVANRLLCFDDCFAVVVCCCGELYESSIKPIAKSQRMSGREDWWSNECNCDDYYDFFSSVQGHRKRCARQASSFIHNES